VSGAQSMRDHRDEDGDYSTIDDCERRLNALSPFRSKSVLCCTFLWARRAHSSLNRRFGSVVL
jgi:hypothetical protein